MPLFSYLQHRRDCKSKQASRANAISSLPLAYHEPLTTPDVEILNTPVSTAAALVRKGEWKPIDILRAYGKRALVAHEKTNCLTEILIPSAEEWLAHSSSMGAGGVGDGVNLNGPLAGIPVSFKDTVNVNGYDSCMGYSRYVNHPAGNNAAIIKLLKDAGAVPFVKTNVPITLLSFESTNDVFGRTDNPHVSGYSPGGSTGGEAALLALGGSRIGIGTDVAGSVRVPAHYSGIYTLRCSTGRFPRAGNVTTMAGQEGVLAVYSPMTKTMGDLSYFLKAIIEMKPWEYDYSVLPIPWRDVKPELEREGRKVRWGVLRDDGVVTPSPACARALENVVQALKSQGEEVVDLGNFPSPYKTLKIASHLLNSDGGLTYSSHFNSFFESNDAGVSQMSFYFALPRWIKFLYCSWVRYVRRDEKWAGLLEGWSGKSAHEQWKLVAERETHKAEWFTYLKEQGIDFVLCVPNALPACSGGGMKGGFSSCGYTFMWNLLDYACGVLPVTTVSSSTDALPDGFIEKLDNAVAKGAYSDYDATKMEGLPVGVQVVARRLEEEKCLWGMEKVVECLEGTGQRWKGIEIKCEE